MTTALTLLSTRPVSLQITEVIPWRNSGEWLALNAASSYRCRDLRWRTTDPCSSRPIAHRDMDSEHMWQGRLAELIVASLMTLNVQHTDINCRFDEVQTRYDVVGSMALAQVASVVSESERTDSCRDFSRLSNSLAFLRRGWTGLEVHVGPGEAWIWSPGRW